ncbi:hypothetical protein [Pseudomonas syringae group genomosp. 3]|uniref:Phosphate binding protein n=1 Tax=Pseudomonas syringae pv. primulae TaxID=251707 RepID=A0A3M4RKX9_9PSED|nr:hypothetical protein [Pseudomonas syringae group genomosp. 3]RMR03302.1 Phosphate binding protein [Pseudomonas syringae pv. primulae]
MACPIPYGTPEFTGFGTTLQRMQLNGLPLVPGYESYSDTNAILQRLADDPAGIAIAAIGQADARIKQVAIIDPITGKLTTGTADEVRNGTNPYTFTVYVTTAVSRPISVWTSLPVSHGVSSMRLLTLMRF